MVCGLLWEERRVDIEPAVFGGAEETGRDKEAKGDGENQVDGLTARLWHLN
jgi:hypothetical protein